MKSLQEKIAVIGCGHMGGAIAHSLMGSGRQDLWLANAYETKLIEFLKEHAKCCAKQKPHVTTSNTEAVKHSRFIFLCVRPLQMKEVALQLKPFLKSSHVLISVAAGVSLSSLKKWSGHKKIVRVMPNLPAQIGLGMSLWISTKLSPADKKTVVGLLRSFGEEIEVSREDMINLGSGISGCGPAYVFAFLETLQNAAKKMGFSEVESANLAIQTLHGSTIYASQQNDSFGILKEKVKTKGGITEAAFTVLESKKWSGILESAIKKTYQRTKEIIAMIEKT